MCESTFNLSIRKGIMFGKKKDDGLPNDGINAADRRKMDKTKQEEDFGKLGEKVRDQSPAGQGIRFIPAKKPKAKKEKEDKKKDPKKKK